MRGRVKETKVGPVLGTDHLPISIKLDVKEGVLRRPAKRRDSGRFIRVPHWSQLGRNTSIKDFISDTKSKKYILTFSRSQITVTMLRCVNIFCWFLFYVYSSVEPKFCDRYSLFDVSARCQINLLALNSLRLPSFELSNNQKLGDDTGVGFWLKFHSKFDVCKRSL